MTELIFPFSSWAGVQGMALMLLIALLIDAVFGDPEWLYRNVPHPVAALGLAIEFLEEQFYDEDDTPRSQIMAGGGLVLICLLAVVSVVALLSVLIGWVAIGGIVLAVFASTLFAARGLFDHVRLVIEGLGSSLYDAREAVSEIVGRDVSDLDEAGIGRAAIETLAENFSDGVIAPAFWFLLFGLPGLAAYKAINTLDSMIGHKNERYLYFGRIAARLDDIVNWPAARITGGLICLAAFVVPGCDGKAAFMAMRRDAGKHRSPNAGWPEAAMAGALGVALAGPRTYEDELVDDAWMGDGRQDVSVDDINRGLTIFLAALGVICLLALLIVLL